jgi:hypothetical protein
LRYPKNVNRFGFSRTRALFWKKVHKHKCKNKDTSLRYKNIEKHAYLGLQSKFWKIKKVEFQNPQTKAPPQLWTKFAKKSGHGD